MVISDADNRLVELWGRGLSVSAIARALGRDRKSVRRSARRLGLPDREGGLLTEGDEQPRRPAPPPRLEDIPDAVLRAALARLGAL